MSEIGTERPICLYSSETLPHPADEPVRVSTTFNGDEEETAHWACTKHAPPGTAARGGEHGPPLP